MGTAQIGRIQASHDFSLSILHLFWTHKTTSLKETYYMGYDFFYLLFSWVSAHNSFWPCYLTVFFPLFRFSFTLHHITYSFENEDEHRANNAMNGDHGFWL